MAAKLESIEMEIVPDEDPDTSYLEQEDLGFEERWEDYQRGDFSFVGVRATATLSIPHGRNTWIMQRISSPGLWGIEDDCGDEYLKEVYENELDVLKSILAELGVKV